MFRKRYWGRHRAVGNCSRAIPTRSAEAAHSLEADGTPPQNLEGLVGGRTVGFPRVMKSVRLLVTCMYVRSHPRPAHCIPMMPGREARSFPSFGYQASHPTPSPLPSK